MKRQKVLSSFQQGEIILACPQGEEQRSGWIQCEWNPKIEDLPHPLAETIRAHYFLDHDPP